MNLSTKPEESDPGNREELLTNNASAMTFPIVYPTFDKTFVAKGDSTIKNANGPPG